MSAAHTLSINMELAVPTEQKLISLDPANVPGSEEFAKNFNIMRDIFCQNSTNMYVLIHACIDFTGPMETADREWLNNEMHDYEKGWSWGHKLLEDVAMKASNRVDSSGERNRILVANADRWSDAEDSRATIITRTSEKFVAWCHNPLHADIGVDNFLDPHLLGNFPEAPANTALPRIRLEILKIIKSNKPELAGMVSAKQKSHWIREFLGQVDIWGKSFGMAEGAAGAGDSNMAMFGPKDPDDKAKSRERSPFTESTNDCKECRSWLCNGKGVMAGDGRERCICYNKAIPFPARASESNKWVVNRCREFIDFEPSFLPNIKAITMGEVYAKLREHNAKNKELRQAHKVPPNPGRSDPANRFNGGRKQVSVPLAELADEMDELEAEMARHERGLIGTGDVSAPLAEAEPAADGTTDDAETAADMLADMQSKLEEQMEKVRALEAAEEQRFARLPPDTRPNMFQTPASMASLAARSPEGSNTSPYNLMRQMQSAGDQPVVPVVPIEPKPLSKSKLSGTALAGKAIAQYEEEKRDITMLAESPGHAFMVLVKSFSKFVVSGKAGHTMLAVLTYVLYRNRAGIKRAAMSKYVELLAALAVLAQWAFANTVLSAQAAFSIKATQFFQSGLTYFGGQMSAQVSEAKVSPDQSVASPEAVAGTVSLMSGPVEEALDASTAAPPPRDLHVSKGQLYLPRRHLCLRIRKRPCWRESMRNLTLHSPPSSRR
jgi:hypothetical protein